MGIPIQLPPVTPPPVVGGIVTNAEVQVFREGTPLGDPVRVYYQAPKEQHFTALGGEILSTLHFAPNNTTTLNPKEADKVQVALLDGHADVDTVSTYTLTTVTRVPGIVPYLCAYFRGFFT